SVEIDALGGSINASTHREMTVYYAKVAAEFAERSIDLLLDMVRNSTCIEEEVERERGVILEELAAVQDNPGEQATLLLDSLIWPGQPHGRDIAGTEETVTNITRDQVHTAYRTQYVGSAAVISIAGAVDVDEITEIVSQRIEGWERGTPDPWLPNQPEHGARSTLITKDTGQTHLSIGMPGLGSRDEDRYALTLLSNCLGEGMSSRLFLRLREDLGLCYDIHSYAAELLDTGMFGIYAGVDPEHAEEALCEIRKELDRLAEPITAAELERAQAVIRSRIQLSMEDTRAVSGWYGAQATLHRPLRSPEDTLARYQSVTLEDLQAVAERIIQPDLAHLAIVGPYESTAPFEAAFTNP
ncbi:MAG: insulinase family protein, partial [Dehalococcoidia bacterium]|nr:insulinase family protein [Dehalococcoidia bacterium]